MFGTIGGVASIKLVLLSCLFCCIQSASKVASAKVGMKNDRLIPMKCPLDNVNFLLETFDNRHINVFLRSYHNILHHLQLKIAGPLADILSRKNFDTIGAQPLTLTWKISTEFNHHHHHHHHH